jgi:hypothetical protein
VRVPIVTLNKGAIFVAFVPGSGLPEQVSSTRRGAEMLMEQALAEEVRRRRQHNRRMFTFKETRPNGKGLEVLYVSV